MRFFRLPKRDPRHAEGEGPWLRFLRIVLIALLFCGVIWGFWMNSERQINRIKNPPAKRLNGVRGVSPAPLHARKGLAEYSVTLMVSGAFFTCAKARVCRIEWATNGPVTSSGRSVTAAARLTGCL